MRSFLLAFRLKPHASGLTAKSIVDDLSLHLSIIVVVPLEELLRARE